MAVVVLGGGNRLFRDRRWGMILDFLISFIVGLLSFVFGLFPSFSPPVLSGLQGTVPRCVVNVLCSFGHHIASVDRWINAAVLLQVLSILVTSLLIAAGVRITVWLYEHFPFKSA